VLHAGGEILVRNSTARERLIVHERVPARARLLFLDSRAATTLADGRTLWPDTEGGRVAVFDGEGVLRHNLRGAPPDGRALSRPLFAFGARDTVWAVESDGSTLRFVAGAPEAWLNTGGAVPQAATPKGELLAGRTIREFGLGPVFPDEPLLEVLDATSGSRSGLGKVLVPDNAMFGQLVNSGWLAVDPDGAIYFASAVRPELQRFNADGRSGWRSVRLSAHESVAPRFILDEGTVRPDFAEVHHGVAIGPDGRIYVLGASAMDPQRQLLTVYDSNGWLVRIADVPRRHAIYADPDGRVAALPSEQALARAPESHRAAFPALALPGLNVPGTLELESYRGRIVVVNFWASWCAPCRQEMPLLDAFAAELDPAEVAVIGLNDDARPEAARRFLRELGIGFASGEGGGRLRSRYPYPGLPYTLVLDRELRVVTAMYGFDGSIEPVRAAVQAELRRNPSSQPETFGPHLINR
jgi:thiol-disulfide isomerase/thioredoxin